MKELKNIKKLTSGKKIIREKNKTKTKILYL